jgi:colanic acid/amylovoran biosynthesis glycosyltransferase
MFVVYCELESTLLIAFFMSVSPVTITYVISQYPAISHTFILGEVNGIREEGIRVGVASINQPDRPFEKLTDAEKAAFNETVFVKSRLKKKLPLYVIQRLIASPKGFFASLATALCLGIRYPRTLPHHIAYWLEAMVVADMAARNNSSHIHAHFSTQACTVAMLAAQMAGIQFSMTVHGPDEFYQVAEQHLEKKFARADFIVCISDFAKSQVMKYTAFDQWGKLYVNNLGVDTQRFTPLVNGKPNTNTTAPVLLCVGRLCNAKGQGVLIAAAKELVARGTPFTIRFVGDGPDRASLEAFTQTHQLGHHIEFLGKVNHDQVQVLQREADIFVIPSFAEGIPIVLMEAMASGTPCVTTHITGIPELFTHGHDGLLVRPGNAIMLADALEQLITDRHLRQQLADNALITVRKKWCLQQSNQRLALLFKQLLTQ